MHGSTSVLLPLALKPLTRLCTVIALIGSVLLSTPAIAATAPTALPKGITQVTSVEGITEYRLQNGLKLLLMPDQSKPTVTVNITYLVGSRHENYGETGMAHLLEHLLFKGTPKNPNIDEQFNKRGMRPNGTTWLDRTNYYEQFQANDDNLQWAIAMEADRMINSFVSKKDLDTEMTVVRNEFEMGENSPSRVMTKRMQSVAFDWHNYGNSTIGNRSDIENVKIENLKAFYRTYYQPDNAVLLVAGKFDENKVLSWVNTSFSKIPAPKRTLPVLWTKEPVQDGERIFEIRRKGDIQFVQIAYKRPAALHDDTNAIEAANEILTNAPNGRLHKQLVETGKAVEVFANGLGNYAPGINIIGAVVKKGDSVYEVKDALLAAIEDFKNKPPTADELARVKRDSTNQFEKLINNHERLGLLLSEYIALGDWRLIFKERDDTDNLTAEQINAAVKRYFVRDNRTIGYFIPDDNLQRAEIPEAPSVADVMKDFKPKVAVAAGEAFDPAPANIDKRTTRTKIGNLDVALLPKKTRGETVNVAMTLRFGDETSLNGKAAMAAATNNLLATGTSKYTRAQLADEMDKLKISGNLFNFQTTRANLPAAINLVSHVLREANFPESEFVQFRERTLTTIESGRSDPTNIASTELALHFNRYAKGDIRAAKTLDETKAAFAALKLDEVKAFYKGFYGASKGELSIVGDFDVDATKQVVATAFKDWNSAAPYSRLVNRVDDIPAVRKTFNTPDKENGFYIARLNLPLKDSDPDFAALTVANYIFGGGSGLNSRLMLRVRQKEGLSYGGSSRLNAGDLDANGSFTISAIAAPQNLAKLEASIKNELTRTVTEGITQEELDRAKSGLLQQRYQARTNDSTLAAAWNNYLNLNRTFAFSQALDDQIKSLTLAQVNAALKKHIDPAKLSVFIAGDEAKAKGGK
jgi:zinc protease